MYTHYFGHLKRFGAIALLLASAVSCTKSDRTPPPDALTGSWKVKDLTIVNGEAGIHRTPKDLNGFGSSGMQFNPDRSFVINGAKEGTWTQEGTFLTVRSVDGALIQFKVSRSDDGAVQLERDLPAADGLSAAVVSYTLAKE